jgi:hypothetical protein
VRRLIENLCKQLARVYIHNPGNLNEFNDVYPAFAGLYTTYEGMGAFQPGGQITLCEACSLASLDENCNQRAMPASPEGLSQRRSRHGALLRKMERHR